MYKKCRGRLIWQWCDIGKKGKMKTGDNNKKEE